MNAVRAASLPFAAVVLALLASTAFASPGGDASPVAGLKEGKIVFDITEGDGKALLVRIESIEETRQDLLKQGIAPRFVLSFRGPATLLVQSDMEKVKPENRPFAGQITALLAQMAKTPGVESLEQCGVAIRHMGTEARNVVPPIKVVANSFVTIMAWETKGYAYIRG
jgi:intracellular sulfur oxidation DsrE/DsrF family protein